MNNITCNPLVSVMDTHKDAIRIAAAKLGFADLKSQLFRLSSLAMMFLQSFQRDMEKVYVTRASRLIPQGDPQSIVIVVSPLTAIIEDQVLQMWQ